MVGKYIVSTIGEYWPERSCREIHAKVHNPDWFEENKDRKGEDFDHAYFKEFGYTEIGYERIYETMVFKAKKSKGLCCCEYVMKEASNLDFESYNKPEEAVKGHMRLCEKWSKKWIQKSL